MHLVVYYDPKGIYAGDSPNFSTIEKNISETAENLNAIVSVDMGDYGITCDIETKNEDAMHDMILFIMKLAGKRYIKNRLVKIGEKTYAYSPFIKGDRLMGLKLAQPIKFK